MASDVRGQLADLRLAVVMLDGIEIKAARTSSRWGSRPRARSSRSACGPGTPRTPRSQRAARPTSSIAWPGRRAGAAVRDRRLQRLCGKAIRQVFGDDVPVQRCVRHKERNVLELLPERDRAADQTSTHPGVAGDRPPKRAGSAQASRDRARARAPRRRRLTARGHGGDADRHPARDHRQAQTNPPIAPTRANR